jgi:hypothetical protein
MKIEAIDKFGESKFVYLLIPSKTVGSNGHWIASKTTEGSELLSGLTGVMGMYICLRGSGAVSFIDYTKCKSPYNHTI